MALIPGPVPGHTEGVSQRPHVPGYISPYFPGLQPQATGVHKPRPICGGLFCTLFFLLRRKPAPTGGPLPSGPVSRWRWPLRLDRSCPGCTAPYICGLKISGPTGGMKKRGPVLKNQPPVSILGKAQGFPYLLHGEKGVKAPVVVFEAGGSG